MKLFPPSIKTAIKEMVPFISSPSVGLRSAWSNISRTFWSQPSQPALRQTKVSLDDARALYYNTQSTFNQGAFFARNIVNAKADFIGTPNLVVTDSTDADSYLNDLVQNHWRGKLWEMYRNSLRDADTWIRLRKPLPTPLLAPGEENIVLLEVVDTDRVTPYYNPQTGELSRVEISTMVYIEDEPFDPTQMYATGQPLQGKEHEIIEILTADQYYYFDNSSQRMLDDFSTVNDWGFIPMVQVFNDFDSALAGGMSELEHPYIFFGAFHEIMQQTRSRHKYLSNPKVKFKVDDVMTFIANNFPDAISDGHFTGQVSWAGKDIFFMESDEDVGFVEVSADTGSTDLLNFIIGCICIAGEVTEGLLLRAQSEGATNTDQILRFKAAIKRKRENLEPYIKTIARMALKVGMNAPVAVKVNWDAIQIEDQAAQAQAASQAITTAEVANRAGVISKKTYHGAVKQFFPGISDFNSEQAQVKDEQAQEQQQQLDFEKKMAEVNPSKSGGGTAGPNTATHNGAQRTRVPVDILPAQQGQ